MGCETHRPADQADPAAQVLRWAREQHLAPGVFQELRLPAALRDASVTGAVDVGRTPDGRTCVLLKTHVGFKGNFVGTLRIDGPLRPGELVDEASRPYVSLAGLAPFEELYVQARTSDRAFDVYFDLN